MKLSIKWTKPATRDKIKILTYWVKRNGSEKYSQKINIETDKAIKSILQNPYRSKGKRSERCKATDCHERLFSFL